MPIVLRNSLQYIHAYTTRKHVRPTSYKISNISHIMFIILSYYLFEQKRKALFFLYILRHVQETMFWYIHKHVPKTNLYRYHIAKQ